MARIAGVDLPRDKRVEIGLTYILGIGLSSSQKILIISFPSGNLRRMSQNIINKLFADTANRDSFRGFRVSRFLSARNP